MRSFFVLCSIALAEEIVSKTTDVEIPEADQILSGSARRLKKNNKYEEAAKAAMEYTNFKSPLVDFVRKSTDPNELLRNESTDVHPEGIVAAFAQNREALQGHALNDEGKFDAGTPPAYYPHPNNQQSLANGSGQPSLVFEPPPYFTQPPAVEQANYRKVAKKGRNTDTLMGQQFRGIPTLFNSNPSFWLPGMQQPDLPYESWIIPLNTQGLKNPLVSGFPNGFNVPEPINTPFRPDLVPLRHQQPLQRTPMMNDLSALPQRMNFIDTPSTEDLYRFSQANVPFPVMERAGLFDGGNLLRDAAYPASKYIGNDLLPATGEIDGGLLYNELGTPYGALERPLAPEYYNQYIGDSLARSYNPEYLPSYATRESRRPAKFGIDVLTPTGAELVQTPWGTPEIVPLPFSTEFVEAPLISNQINHGTAARVLPNSEGVWVSEATLPEPAYSRRSRFATNLPLREPSVALPEFPILRDTLADQFNVDLLEE